MRKLKRTEFEKIVKEGIEAIPKKFLRKLDNVVIVIEDEPTPAQKKKLNPVRSKSPETTANLQAGQTSNGVNIHSDWTLFGLYEGVPQVSRGTNYTAVLPDKITIFQKPIEKEAHDEKDMKELVKNTVWHEIAHYFGMDEARVRQVEIQRRKTSQISRRIHLFVL